MGVSVAEYLGQRTDIAAPIIAPASTAPVPNCPFMNSNCEKVSQGKKPVCSVRKNDGTLWIVCRHRLCATKKSVPLSGYQANRLHEVAKTIFNPLITQPQVIIKREVAMPVVGRSKYHADFIMRANRAGCQPDRVVLEMQGGGETSNTGQITAHVQRWENNPNKTNAMLSQQIRAVGTIETNAWRRQQEQFIVKGNIAINTGGAITFCVGQSLYDYLWARVANANMVNLRHHNWTLALIGFSEDTAVQPGPGPVPIVLNQARQFFTNYAAFVSALTTQGTPSPTLFRGQFQDLAGTIVNIP